MSRCALGSILALLLLVCATAALRAEGDPSPERVELNLETFDRAWELVAQRHWDPELGGVDWNAVRDELRPEAARAADDRELREVLERMVERLGQSHFGVIPGSLEDAPAEAAHDRPSCAAELSERLLAAADAESPTGDPAGPGFDVAWSDGATLVVRVDPHGPAARAGVAMGWELVRVDDQPLADIARCLGAGLDARALRALQNEMVGALLGGEPGDAVEVELLDGAGRRHVVKLEREEPSDTQIAHFGNLPPLRVRFEQREVEMSSAEGGEPLHIGVLRFNIWMIPIANLFEDAIVELQDADGIVLDLRGNPGGIAGLAPGIAGFFLDEKLTLGTLRYRNDELRLQANPRRVTRTGQRITPFAGPLALLVDAYTGSTSEIFAAALQDHERARLFGETTAAAALPAVIERLPNGDLFMHALADLERPGGGRIEGIGVVPDEAVPVTREGLLRGIDEPLQAALDWIAETASGAAVSGSASGDPARPAARLR